MSAASAPVLLFDGDCAFCSSTVRAAQRCIKRHPAIEPYQLADIESLGVTVEQCERAVQFVDGGRVWSGELAVARFLRRCGRGWQVAGWFIGAPGIRWLSGIVYRAIARNRYRLPGGTAACQLPRRETA
jgi:predicted DCC family thiol-disulfide oxidoreductase YuxK